MSTPFPPGVLRILDAAINRAREGLRVVEDYTRFVLDDPELTGRLKSLRHDLVLLLTVIPYPDRLAARDTTSDVGTAISVPSERTRSDIQDVLTANFNRVEESLRSLEEFSKCTYPDLAAGLEQIRYRVYTLQKDVQNHSCVSNVQ